MRSMKKLIWMVWIVLTLSIASYYGYEMFVEEHKSSLLIGEATHGHYQIEMSCGTCHTEAFGGGEVIQEACESCHAQELELAHDSHPRKKFTDPRNADLLEQIDARYCVSCHNEHQREQTHEMGLTLPKDYCFHCHEDVLEERESHQGLAFDSCASAGCHNYHDNRALYESFLVEHANKPWLDAMARIAEPRHAQLSARKILDKTPAWQAFALNASASDTENTGHWDGHLHVQKGMSCAACHASNEQESSVWIEKPGLEQCASCHQKEAEGYQQGKHGMRLAQNLSAMTPAQSRSLEFSHSALQSEHGCTTCHQAHEFDTAFAATQACLSCHQDEHSTAFESSPHGQLTDDLVTCATCHMPRLETMVGGEKVLRVEHNQNAYLRPNEKMIRPVCMQCHSLEFSIDALADETLINNNFNGKPAEHVPSMDWAVERDQRH